MLAKKDPSNSLSLAYPAEIVTPFLAGVFVTEFSYPRQRTIQRPLVNAYIREMKAGTFLQPTPLVFAILNGKKYLIDGYHRLHAQQSANIPLEYFFLYYSVQSEEELHNLYARIDCGQGKTPLDRGKALGVYDEFKKAEVSANRVTKAGAAIYIIEAAAAAHGILDTGHREVRSPYALKSAIDWSDEITQYHQLTMRQSTGRSHIFWRRAVTVIALATLRYQKEKANEFWSKVIKDDGLKIGDPCKKLHDFIATTSVIGGTGTKQGKGIAQASSYIRTVTKCWNLFYEGKTALKLTFNEFPNAQLNGTPYKVK